MDQSLQIFYTYKTPSVCLSWKYDGGQGDHSPGKPGSQGIPKWSGKSQGGWNLL